MTKDNDEVILEKVDDSNLESTKHKKNAKKWFIASGISYLVGMISASMGEIAIDNSSGDDDLTEFAYCCGGTAGLSFATSIFSFIIGGKELIEMKDALDKEAAEINQTTGSKISPVEFNKNNADDAEFSVK